jgi:twitching motility protein PilJ
MALDLKALLRKKTPGDAQAAAATKSSAKSKIPLSADQVVIKPLPLIGKLPAAMQYQILGAIFLIGLMVAMSALYLQNRESVLATNYVLAAGEVRLLAHQLPAAAANANAGSTASFKEIRKGLPLIRHLLAVLGNGGEYNETVLPATTGVAKEALEQFNYGWDRLGRAIEHQIKFEEQLTTLGNLGEDVRRSGWMGDAMTRLANPQAKAAVDRIIPNLTRLTSSNGYDAALKREIATDIEQSLPILMGDTRVQASMQDYLQYLKALPDDGDALNITRQVASEQQVQSKAQLSRIADELVDAYQTNSQADNITPMLVAVSGSVAMLMLSLIVKVFRDDATQRQGEALRQQHAAEAAKDATQAAILRLMNEMGDLADGDLTVRATVSEDVTGAIADSVNYTIEELSVLVGRINKAAAQVTTATSDAKATSDELLTATETQTREIELAGSKVEDMAHAMTDVAHNAQESAKVARISLEVAHKGSVAVNESISGMNEIRGQIQETAKRIKRLGESSQEIGEIVELISDITEQTNVLALNAAIQAASAGEAGRGFSVVAEEVQRLAERSGEATKQIAALVKTIQTDTHDAVAAMESSTQNVVEGTKRSDAAGQALTEISAVTKRLAQLIENISSSTQEQTETAKDVAMAMNEILRVTKLTTSGTQQTAISVGELAALATELKGSVSGFKV